MNYLQEENDLRTQGSTQRTLKPLKLFDHRTRPRMKVPDPGFLHVISGDHIPATSTIKWVWHYPNSREHLRLIKFGILMT